MPRSLVRYSTLLLFALLTACSGGDAPVAPVVPLPPPAPEPLPPGTLVLTVSGLPAGTNADVSVSGTSFARSANGSITWSDLAAGRYTVNIRPTRGTDGTFTTDSASFSVDVVSGGPPTVVTARYRALPSAVDLQVSGVPGGAEPPVRVLTPGRDTIRVSASSVLTDSVRGVWRVLADTLSHGGARYAPSSTAIDLAVLHGDTARASITFAVSSGALALSVKGLPDGVVGESRVEGPNGFVKLVSGSATLTGLAPGVYRVISSALVVRGVQYFPERDTLSLSVDASLVASPAVVQYRAQVGQLIIATSGLPADVAPPITVSGSLGAQTVAGSTTLDSLPVGTYTVSATALTVNDVLYEPSLASQSVTLSTGGSTTLRVAYVGSGPNYSIAQLHITQATQRYDGSVPLVAGRDALLRVFVIASKPNSAKPNVRVRLYDGATLLQSTLIAAPEQSVRQSVSPGILSSSWNVIVPAAQLRPDLRVLAELDPSAQLDETNRSDNIWPASGTPQTVSAYDVPPFSVRFIPVVTGALKGDVSEANANAFLESARLMLPLNEISADVRAPFTSSATELLANDANGGWLTVLSEVNALRATDSAPGSMHYYGVVATSYNSGVAGYGYLPGRAAIGWDKMPSGDGVAAHEWGHNFGIFHAPCGTAGDPRYPYANANIGQIGWNVFTNTLVPADAKDLMSYCSNTWISDYTWSAIMQQRGPTARLASARAAAAMHDKPTDALLVWGRVIDGRVQLEPAFRVRAAVSASVQGTHRVELLDDGGTFIADVGMVATSVDHASDRDERHFAVVLPFNSTTASRLASIRVRDVRSPLLSSTRSSAVRAQLIAQQLAQQSSQQNMSAAASATIDPAAQMNTIGRKATRVAWSNRNYSMAMVRDAQSGEIMGFVRRSGDAVMTNGRPVEVVFSDGVRSEVRR